VHRGLLRIVQAGMDHTPPCPIPSCFTVSLREQEGIAARVLKFAILTAARTSEVSRRAVGRNGGRCFNRAQFTGAATRWKSGS
jgi:hypothetical protein